MTGVILIYSLAFLLAVIFAGAAWHKARDVRAFSKIVVAYEVLPSSVTFAAAYILIVTEGLAVMLLALTPWMGAAGLFLAGAILAAYASALMFNFIRGNREIDCGCSWGGGNADKSGITIWHILRTATLSIAALSSGGIYAVAAYPAQGMASLVISASLTLTAAVIYAACETLIENQAKFERAGI